MLSGTRTRIKICGVRDPETALAAAEAGADAVGLVFVERSPRYVTHDVAARIVRELPSFVEPVGLFVDTETRVIQETAARVGLSTVQLHGREQPEQVADLSPLRVIKAMPFDASHVEAMAADWKVTVERLAGWLWDCPTDANGLGGGTGRSFDWAALSDVRDKLGAIASASIILAGGLTPQNVGEAIRVVRPWAVDVSSGVESSRGVKDPERIAEFCRQVTMADQGV